MTTTIVETGIARKLTVVKHSRRTANLHVRDTDLDNHEVNSSLPQGRSEKLVMPCWVRTPRSSPTCPKPICRWLRFVTASGYDRTMYVSPEEVLAHAKALLAIHKFLVEKQAKDAEAEAEGQG